MYLKLGETEIKYFSNYSDLLILSEVVDSNMSFEKPVLIRSEEELDIWFGKSNFSSRDYLLELLGSKVTLYLYRPISNLANTDIDNYINLDNYSIDSQLYYSLEDLPKVGTSNVKYKIVNSESIGEIIDPETGLSFDFVIWLEEDYVYTKDLPQFIDDFNTKSLSNRDTLRLLSSGNNTLLEYTYPKYIHKSTQTSYDEVIDVDKLKENLPNLGKINLDLETLAFDINLSNVTISDYQNTTSPYIILPSVNEGIGNLIWFNSTTSTGQPLLGELGNLYDEVFEIQVDGKNIFEIAGELLNIVKNLGYEVKNLSDNGLSWTLYASRKLKVTYLYQLNGLYLEPNLQITHNILTKFIDLYDDTIPVLEFISKTIGHESDGKISIQIEKLTDTFNYRLLISRYDYLEIYEGTLVDVVNEINSKSLLVTSSLLKYSYLDEDIPIGIWELSRGIVESYDPSMYNEALISMFVDSEGVFPDYHLVPDISLYKQSSTSFNEVYEYILELSKIKQFQVLIENTDDNYIYNLTSDSENRLIYFYKSVQLRGFTRPGYYVFISGLIRDTYSNTVTDVVYQSPVKNPYEEEDIELILKNYKCNYLVDNNLIYYYKQYFSGEKSLTSIWVRFCLSKVYRELEKNKWSILTYKSLNDITQEISRILLSITTNFTIINSISIVSLDINNTGEINLTLDTIMSDLTKNNISLDITLNYNK